MKLTDLPRKDYMDIGETLTLVPLELDRKTLTYLLEVMSPTFLYRDPQSLDWVRWELPIDRAEELGLDKPACACCDSEPLKTDTHLLLDIAVPHIRWHFEDASVVRGGAAEN